MKHIHKYIRKDIASRKDKSYVVYQCALSNCLHYIRERMIFGKMSHCWDCDKEFVIIPRGTRPCKRKPICDECWNNKYGSEEIKDKKVEEILKAAGAL